MARERTFDRDGNAPYIFDNNWANWGNLPTDARRLTMSNADGESVVELTEEQKFTFDTNGWLVIPGLLDDDDLKEMRDFCYRLKDQPDSLPAHMRTPIAGPLEKLVDHPVVVGFCNEFLAYPALASEDYYGFQYNSIGSRFHWWEPPQELLETMPPLRQSLFRHAYSEGTNTGLSTRNLFERAIG